MKRCANDLIPLPKRAKVDSGLSFVDLPIEVFCYLNQFLSFEEWCALKGTCHTIRYKILRTRHVVLLTPRAIRRFPLGRSLSISRYELLRFINNHTSSQLRFLKCIQTLHIREQVFPWILPISPVLEKWPRDTLKELIVERYRIINRDLEYVGQLTELTKLSIQGFYATTLEPLCTLSSLRTLSLQNARRFGLKEAHLVKLLKNLPHLEHFFWLNSRSIPRKAVQQLAKISCLRIVDFTGSVIQKPAYSAFAKLTQLHTLRISGSRMTLDNINHLKELPLKELGLRSDSLGKYAFSKFPQSLQRLLFLSNKLREFYYQGTHLHTLHLQSLVSIITLKELPRLRHLFIERGVKIRAFTELVLLPSLETFSIQTIAVTLLSKLMSLPLTFPNTSPQYWISTLNTGCPKEQLKILSKQIYDSIP